MPCRRDLKGMMKQVSKPDYGKMGEGELRVLLNKHQQMLSNTRLVNALPDKGERLRNAINEIESFLVRPSTPMDCDVLTNQFRQITMPSAEHEMSEERVYLEKPVQSPNPATSNDDFSEQRLNEVKQRLKARQAERQSKGEVTTAKLISLDEAVRLCVEEKKAAEEHLIQQTTARLLGNMSLSKATFGLPSTTANGNLTYRRTAAEEDDDDDMRADELGRDRAEIVSDHDSDEIDYPEEGANDDDDDH